MKLNKTQQKFLSKNGWGVISSTEHKDSNCAWVGFGKEDGEIFKEVCDVFGLKTDCDHIELLVIGAKEVWYEANEETDK